MNLKSSVKCFLLVLNLLLISVMASEICTTPSCINAATQILEQMDQTIEPCNDFYNFACGKFMKETVIPYNKGLVNTFSINEDKLQGQLLALISSPIEESEIKPFKIVKKLYKACMNATLEKRELQPLMNLHESLGGWPVVEDNKWNETSWTWQNVVKELNKLGWNNFLFSISIEMDPFRTTNNVIMISETEPAFKGEVMIQGIYSKNVQAYHSYQVDIAVLFGANRSQAEIEMKDCLEFEIKLANISKIANRNVYIVPITIKELQNKYPYIQWLDYFKDIFQESANVTEDEMIAVAHDYYFNELGMLLEKTPKRTIANFLMWKITMIFSKFLTHELVNGKLQYTSIFNGTSVNTQSWEKCLSNTHECFNIATSALYVRKHFQEGSKAEVMDMVNNIKKEFEIILQNAPWMDEQTRAAALDKIKFMSLKIGYPDELMDDQKLIEYYQDYDVDENKFLESFLNLSILIYQRELKHLRIPYNKHDWTAHSNSAKVKAVNVRNKNTIEISASFLQGKFFSADRPRYMNYGAIGFIIGHEITHGFDNKGSKYEKEGNLVNWWQEDSKVAFLEKVQCFIEQYGNLTEPNVELPLNGIITQAENIADNAGIKIAYFAYKKWAETNGQEETLPALNYSSSQLFWISAAQKSCSIHRSMTMQKSIKTGKHSPEQFRVLVPLSNMKEFSMDFNCPEGSPMNPKNKCEVW